MSSTIEFDRWNPKNKFSFPYSSYVAYGSELRKMYRTMLSAHKYTYKSLKDDRKAEWKDNPNMFFEFSSEVKKTNAFFCDLKEWSEAYNALENWNNLNALVAINANFETYMVKIIKLSLESDVGVLYGMSQELDGIKAIKHGNKFDFSKEVTSCTKGDWSSRIKYIKKYFGEVPTVLESNIDKLEKIRNLRNNVSHSFGRKIDDAQKIHDLTKLSIDKLNSDKLLEYWALIDDCVRDLDKQLFKKHIGEYQLLFLYHSAAEEITNKINSKVLSTGNKAREFRKIYGRADKNGINTLGQKFCKGLITYYDSIV